MNEEINAFMAKYLEINERIKKLKDQKSNIKAKVLIFLKTEELDRYDDDDGNIMTLKSIKRRTLDKDKLANWFETNADEDLSDFYIENETEILRIVSKKTDDKYGN